MKKFDRQLDEKPVESHAADGHDRSRPEPKAPNAVERQKRKTEHRPENPGGSFEKVTPEPEISGERGDRTSSGRPVQLEKEKGTAPPGQRDREPGRGGWDARPGGRSDDELVEH